MLPAGKTSNQQHSQAGFIFRSFLSWVLFRCQSKELEVHISAQPATPSSSPDLSEERAVTYICSPVCVGLPKPPSIAPLRFMGFITGSTLIYWERCPERQPQASSKASKRGHGAGTKLPRAFKSSPTFVSALPPGRCPGGGRTRRLQRAAGSCRAGIHWEAFLPGNYFLPAGCGGSKHS